jgi:transposase
MNEVEIFSAALSLAEPWKVMRTEFIIEKKELHIYIDFPRGSLFKCPGCQAQCTAYDTDEKEWRHLDFFQHKAFLHARVPRTNCKVHGPLVVQVPWSRPNSGFTLLFEVLILTLMKSMPASAIARLIGEHDTLIWRIVRHHVDEARSRVDMSSVRKVGIDETSLQKHHKYLSIFVDLDTSKVLFATPGKDGSTVAAFVGDLVDHGGSAMSIKETSIDMSEAYIKGVTEFLPKASITFDKFHVTKLVTDALDKVRREEQKESAEHYEQLKKSKFALLGNPENLSNSNLAKLDIIKLSSLNLKSARAWRMKEAFREVYSLFGEKGIDGLGKWCNWAIRSRLTPMKTVAETIKRNWDGVVRYFKSHITNAILESINSIFQSTRAKARGYRNVDYATTILYLICGGLGLPDLNRTHTK